jgi:hypothetical protein
MDFSSGAFSCKPKSMVTHLRRSNHSELYERNGIVKNLNSKVL